MSSTTAHHHSSSADPSDSFGRRGRLVVRTEPFTVASARGSLRGLAQFDPGTTASRGTVVVAPPFGVATRRGQGAALYFLLNGFDVIRYDPTNHVGHSDGEIVDLTSSALVEDLGSVLRWTLGRDRGGPVALFASSLSARLGFATLAAESWELSAVGTISAVVDMRASIAAANEDDYVGRWLRGERHDPDGTETIMDHRIRWRFVQDLVERDWHSAESTARDLASMGPVPLLSVHGARDRWVDVAEAQRVLGHCERASLVVLSDAVHSLNPVSARTAMSEVVRFFRDPAGDRTGPVLVPGFDQIVAQGKAEARLEQRDGTKPPFVDAVHQDLRGSLSTRQATSL
ncbi:hypothetical protein ACFW9L_07730 [Streptomyces sp. NPDC059517]|uniref:hypothetical protein n=1 Tax=Streptomyces sp. NPDC059517 TaxID=3346855 RepID=UPI0036B5489C